MYTRAVKMPRRLAPMIGGRRRVRRVVRKAVPMLGGRRRVVRRRVAPRRPSTALMGGRRTVRRGRGWLWDKVKSGFNAAKDFAKNNQLISKGIRMIPGKYSEPAAEIAERAGYGRRRRVRRGAGWWDTVKSGFNTAKDFVKNNQLISRGVRMIPGKYSQPIADIAERAGYGRRRRGGRQVRTGGRVMFPAVYTTGLAGMAATI
jgi:hypothetical protein